MGENRTTSNIDNSNRLIAMLVMLFDIVVINLLLFLFDIFWKYYYGVNVIFGDVVTLFASLCISYVISSFGSGVILYHRRVRPDQVVFSTLKGMTLFFFIWITMLSFFSHPAFKITRPFFYYMIFVTILVIALRIALFSAIKHLRSIGRNSCKVVYLGSTESMIDLYKEMAMSLETGYRVDGYFDDVPNHDFPRDCKYLGTSSEALDYIKNNSIEKVYSSLNQNHSELILSVIEYCEGHMIRFYSVPNLRNYLQRRVNLEMFSGVPLLNIRPEPLSNIENRAAKRTFDIAFSLCFLLTIFPAVLIVVGIITKCTSKGPIFFVQKRNGLDGKEFSCYKFRSMKVNNEADLIQATENDSRKTKFGDFLRRSSIDELPQFFNVLIGDMSVVGPRPHMLKHTEEYSKLIDTYMVRHLVKPGITGMAQITGYRGETTDLSKMVGRVKADIWYMEHWNFMLDIYIVYKTVANIVTRKDQQAY